MKVKTLINKLSKLPGNRDVVIEAGDQYFIINDICEADDDEIGNNKGIVISKKDIVIHAEY